MKQKDKTAKLSTKEKPDYAWMKYLAAVIVITFFALRPMLDNGFATGWDDDKLYQSSIVQSPVSWENTKAIFHSTLGSCYMPVPVLFINVLHQFKGMNPGTFHWFGLFCHLLSMVLVFFNCILWVRLLKKNTIFKEINEFYIASLVALWFGIHPMHVESVAWIAEIKDQLFHPFYMAAMISYFYSKQQTGSKAYRYWFLTLIFFLLSLLSKGQAVIFPVSLILVELFLENKKFSLELFKGKYFFFILSLGFGILAYFVQKKDAAVGTGFSYINILSACYGFIMYQAKLIFPVGLLVFYPRPEIVNGMYPVIYYICPGLIAVEIFLLWKFRQNKVLMFGVLWFVANIGPELQLLPVGSAVMADRYSYLPYTGLFFAIAVIGYSFWQKNTSSIKTAITSAAVMLTLFWMVVTYQRTKLWGHIDEMFISVIEKYPSSAFAHNQLAYTSLELGKLDISITEFTKSIELDTPNSKTHYNRGIAYMQKNENDKAIADFTKAITIRPWYYDAYNNRGTLYGTRKNYERAISDFTKAIALRPDCAEAYQNIGGTYLMMGNSDSAISYFKQSIAVNSQLPDSYLDLAAAYQQKGMTAEVIDCYKKALALNPELTDVRAKLDLLMRKN